MILAEDFYEEWAKMETFVGQRLSTSKQLQYWHEEIEHLDTFIFREACRRLGRAGLKVKLNDFFSMYAKVEQEEKNKNNEEVGCERCDQGRVAYWKQAKSYKGGPWVSYLAACGYCKPAKFHSWAHLCSDKSYEGISFKPVYPKNLKTVPENSPSVSLEGKNVSPSKAKALLRGAGLAGKHDPKKELKRKGNLEAPGFGVETEPKKSREEIWF